MSAERHDQEKDNPSEIAGVSAYAVSGDVKSAFPLHRFIGISISNFCDPLLVERDFDCFFTSALFFVLVICSNKSMQRNSMDDQVSCR